MEQNNKKTIIIMSVIVILMTLLGYVCGVLSNNVAIARQSQKECYIWLEENCPCIFGQTPQYEIPNLNLTGGQNVQNNESVEEN